MDGILIATITGTHNTKQNAELSPPPSTASHQILFYQSIIFLDLHAI